MRFAEAAAPVDDIVAEHRASTARPATAIVTSDHEATTTNQAVAKQPPAKAPEVFDRAVDDYRIAIALGAELPSERRLCEKYGVPTSNRRWARRVIARANKPPAEAVEVSPTST